MNLRDWCTSVAPTHTNFKSILKNKVLYLFHNHHTDTMCHGYFSHIHIPSFLCSLQMSSWFPHLASSPISWTSRTPPGPQPNVLYLPTRFWTLRTIQDHTRVMPRSRVNQKGLWETGSVVTRGWHVEKYMLFGAFPGYLLISVNFFLEINAVNICIDFSLRAMLTSF